MSSRSRAAIAACVALIAGSAPQLDGQGRHDPTGARVTRANPVRPSALANLIDEMAGQSVRVSHARVVGVLNPQAFLIESATSFPLMLGTRDRILVLVDGGGSLRVSADLVVGSNVVVVGIARTLVGMQITREVQWPVQLTREAVNRLEVRAAVLATSVQTPEGVELAGFD